MGDFVEYCRTKTGNVHFDPPQKPGDKFWNLHRAIDFSRKTIMGTSVAQTFYGITKVALT